jgi:hypothetical protein
MNRCRAQAPLAVALMIAGAAAPLLAATSSVASRSAWRQRLAVPGAHSQAAGSWPILPPPLVPYLPTFMSLYNGYQALPAPKPCSFSTWVIRHGVTDPMMHRAMLELYRFVERASLP